MRIASYMGTPAGVMGLGDRLIRLRFDCGFFTATGASHTELVFEPGDGVDELMPDGTTQPDANGAYWCASSTMLDQIPEWAPKRAGSHCGVRFKRIAMNPTKWQINRIQGDAMYAARWFREHEGDYYDWRMISTFVFWPIGLMGRSESSKACSSAVAEALKMRRADLFHPEILRQIASNPI